MSKPTLRKQLIKLAYQNPGKVRDVILPVLGSPRTGNWLDDERAYDAAALKKAAKGMKLHITSMKGLAKWLNKGIPEKAWAVVSGKMGPPAWPHPNGWDFTGRIAVHYPITSGRYPKLSSILTVLANKEGGMKAELEIVGNRGRFLPKIEFWSKPTAGALVKEFKKQTGGLIGARQKLGLGAKGEVLVTLLDVERYLNKRGVTYMDHHDGSPEQGYVSYATRDGGSVYDETAGDRDIRHANGLVKDLKTRFPAFDVRMGIVDEWVSVTVTQKNR
jgi:hypothetical protein